MSPWALILQWCPTAAAVLVALAAWSLTRGRADGPPGAADIWLAAAFLILASGPIFIPFIIL